MAQTAFFKAILETRVDNPGHIAVIVARTVTQIHNTNSQTEQ